MYVLAGDPQTLVPGRRVALTGKKIKDPAGKLTFHVQQVTNVLGSC